MAIGRTASAPRQARTLTRAILGLTDGRRLQTIQGLGRDANWYPPRRQLQATDGRVLVTVTVRSTGLSPDRRRDLATAVAGA